MMKGVEKSIQNLIFIFATLVFVFILLSLAAHLLKRVEIPKKRLTLEGSKPLVLTDLAQLIYSCWEDNEGRKESIICYQVQFNTTEEIKEEDLVSILDCERIPDNVCDNDCSYCVSSKYEDDDKIVWEAEILPGDKVVISYRDYKIRVKVIEREIIRPSITNFTLNDTSLAPGDSIRINATVTDPSGVDEVWVRITYPDTSTTEKSMNKLDSLYTTTFNDTSQLGTYQVRVYANNTLGNLAVSINKSFEVTVGCLGSVALNLNPNPSAPSSKVTASVSGLSDCDGKIAYVESSKLECNCSILGSGCSCSFIAPASPGDYSYCAKVDKNNDGDFDEPGEVDCENLIVQSLVCSPEDLAKRVDSSIMLDNILYLTQKPRRYGSEWNRETADWISDKLKLYGLENVHFENFGIGRNVVGEVGQGSDVILVTGGHRDSVGGCPGAVDNAAGTAVVMEAARIIATCKDKIKDYKIRFVLFDGEELGLLGSIAYVNAHSGENIQRMLNFDCPGYKNSNAIRIYRTATDLSTSVDKACSLLPLPCNKRSRAACNSDHCPFGLRGIGYLFAISYAGGATCGKCYHCMRCTDDISQVGSTQLEWAGKLAVYVLADLYISK